MARATRQATLGMRVEHILGTPEDAIPRDAMDGGALWLQRRDGDAQ